MSDRRPPVVYYIYRWPGDCGDTEEEFPPRGEPALSAEERAAWDAWTSLSPKEQAVMRHAHPEIAPLWSWDYGFIPIGAVAIGCGASSPAGMRCTRDPGHQGDCASHASPRLMMAKWRGHGGD